MKHLSLLLFLLFLSCSGDKFRKVEQIKDFRVLAIVADTPEVSSVGGTVHLQLYVSDVNGAGRTITGTTVSCIDPGIGSGAPVTCDYDPTKQVSTYTINTSVGDPSTHSFTGLNSSILNVNVPAFVLTNRSGRESFNGVAYITIFEFNVDGKVQKFFKRINVTDRGMLNANPATASILLDGQSYSGVPHKNSALFLSSNDQESYIYEEVDGKRSSREETYEVAWFATSGELNRPKSETNEKVKFIKGPESTGFVLIAVVRDDRGGVLVLRE
jgi:hypothetical protein